jgi:tetratricopeptide (TPR) repeat protein
MAVLTAVTGCVGTKVNSYLFDDAVVGGDPSKSLKPVKNLLVWPLENIAAGAKSKGVETRFTGVLVDTFYMRGGFEKVVILEEDQAKDLMTRAGEELGLKKKPKAPSDGALIATKLGQLTGTEAVLTGRIEDYDEDKVDKATFTVVSASFNLIDAREKSYAALDSFTPVKRIWRSNVKRASKEGPFNARESLDETARAMFSDTVDRLSEEMGVGKNASGKAQEKRIVELNDAADKSLSAGDYDKAVASWNEVLKIDPENKKAKRRIEDANERKKEAQEKEKAAGLKKQIDEIAAKAGELEKAGDLEGATAQWKKVLEVDKGNKDATKKIEKLEKSLADQKKKAAEDAEKKKVAEEAEKKKAEEAEKKKAPPPKPEPAKTEAPKAEPPKAEPPKTEAPKVEPPKAEPPKIEAPKAEPPKTEAPKAEPPKAEPPKAAPPKTEAPKVEPPKAEAPKVEPPKAEAPAKPAEKAPAAAAGGSDLDTLRNQAMAAFNKEDYAAARDLWKKVLEKVPDDKQGKEMLETTEMLLNALK